jgi:flagellin-specific chaperone FliS
MPQYVLEKYLVSIAFNRFDEMVVLEYNKRSNERVDEWGPSVTLFVEWLVKRAKQMQTFVGNVDDVVNFTEVGMKCSSTSIDENNFDTGISSVQELHTTWRAALSLKRMLLDQAVSIDGDGINTDDLMGMDLVELLDLVLDCGNQSSIIRYRFDEYIQPLVMEMSISSSSDNLDEALAVYCLKEAQKCTDLQAAGAKHALASAVAIAEISKASLHKKNRLIKDKTKLIYMVLNVIDEISKNLDVVEISMNDRREIIESFWSLYETLPARLVTPESENEVKLQSLYDDLVGTDILSRWPECDPFKFFNRRQSGRQHEEHMFQKENCDALEICKSFTSAITAIESSQNRAALLQDLLCDVQSLNDVVFKNSLDLSTILCKYLVPTFLEKGYFGLVASYLRSDENVVDRKQVIRNVIEYVDEAMFSEGDNMNKMSRRSSTTFT